MIEHTKKLVEDKFTVAGGYEHNAEVIYGDTDSVMVHFGVSTVEEAMKLGSEAAEFISRTFTRGVELGNDKADEDEDWSDDDSDDSGDDVEDGMKEKKGRTVKDDKGTKIMDLEDIDEDSESGNHDSENDDTDGRDSEDSDDLSSDDA